MITKNLIAKNKILKLIDNLDEKTVKSIISNNPSLRGIFCGYWAEYQFQKFISRNRKVKNIKKYDDHDRLNNKIDREFLYKSKYGWRKVSVQLKSIQTNSLKWDDKIKCFRAVVQNDASCKRTISLKNNEKVCTTNYKVGDYDILVVPLYPFASKNKFAYKLNKNCKRTNCKKYTKYQQQQLLSTTEKICYPLSDDWTEDLDSIIKKLWKN